MGTKTISLSEDAYERLRAAKRENESFSDVVLRLTSDVKLAEFHGVLSEESAAELEAHVRTARGRQDETYERRVERIAEELDDS